MEIRRIALAAAAAAAVLAASCGCASGRAAASGARDPALKPFTPMPSGSRWITPRQVSGMPAVVLAVVDFDFSGRDVAIRYCPAAFRPDPSGAMALVAFEPPVRLDTVSRLRDEMAKRTEAGPVAMAVLADGRPVGEEGAEIPAPLMAFLASFDSDLKLAGVDSAYLLPSRDFTLSLPPEGPVR